MDEVRSTYRTLSEDEKALVAKIKATGQAMLAALADSPGREIALAKTKIEEAVMWAVKGVTG